MQTETSDFPQVVVIGAACVDIKGRTDHPFTQGSSVPGEVGISLGGSARNMAESLGRFGVHTHLLAAVGADSFGRMIREHTAASGVDISHSIISTEHPSATYVRIIDPSGNQYVGIDDMAIVSTITPEYLLSHRDLLRRAKMIAIDANLRPRTLAAIFTLGRRYRVPICANPVSVALAPRLKSHLRDCAIVTPNAVEAAILTDVTIADLASSAQAAQRLVALGVGLAIVTMGEEGVFYASKAGASGHVPAVRCEVVDSTGAGDALAAAVVYGLVNDFPLDEAIHLGVSAATMALSSKDTVNPELSLENLYQALAV